MEVRASLSTVSLGSAAVPGHWVEDPNQARFFARVSGPNEVASVHHYEDPNLAVPSRRIEDPNIRGFTGR